MARIAGTTGGGADVAGLLAGMPAPAGAVAAIAGPLGWRGLGEPALAEAEGLAVALDGALYNARELDSDARSEAELVARLVRRYGPERALARLNGDFAVALWDEAERTLWLARDRFGVRPLYWARHEDGVVFASQPRTLTRLPGVGAEPERRYVAVVAASHYRVFDNEPERSPYARVAQLPAAHLLRVRGGETTLRRWWSIEDAPPVDGSPAELAERYRELLLDAVAIRVARLRRPAFTLSGGMDSSSVLSCAVAVTGERQHAFSTVYEDATYDESAEIRTILDATVAAWHTVPIGDNPDVLGLVERMVAVHDEPVATATWLSHFVLEERAAAEGFGAMLGGLGGDELNAGEHEYFPYHFADLRLAGREDELAHEVREWARHHDHPVFRKGPDVAERELARLVDPARPGRFGPDRARLERYAAALNPELFDLRAYEPVLEFPFDSYLLNRTWQDLSRETAPCCLRAEDRHANAFGLGHALPFLDHRLAELMFRVPGDLKIRDGITKRLLREAMAGIVPEQTRTRIAKTGWNAPAHRWFSGPGREPLLDLIRSQAFRERGIYDVVEVERLAAEHEEIVASRRPAENHMMFLWQLVNLELWLRSL